MYLCRWQRASNFKERNEKTQTVQISLSPYRNLCHSTWRKWTRNEKKSVISAIKEMKAAASLQLKLKKNVACRLKLLLECLQNVHAKKKQQEKQKYHHFWTLFDPKYGTHFFLRSKHIKWLKSSLLHLITLYLTYNLSWCFEVRRPIPDTNCRIMRAKIKRRMSNKLWAV